MQHSGWSPLALELCISTALVMHRMSEQLHCSAATILSAKLQPRTAPADKKDNDSERCQLARFLT